MTLYKIDEWLDKIRQELVQCNIILQMLFGYEKYDKIVYKVYDKKLKQVLGTYNNYLLDNTFLVGHKPTIADLALANFLVAYFRYHLDEKSRKKYVGLTRYFDFMIHQKSFVEIIGRVWNCETILRPIGYLK